MTDSVHQPPGPTICHVLHSLNVGGAEVLARQFAEREPSPFRAVFACLDELGSMGDALRRAGFSVKVLDRKPGFDLGCARRLSQFLRREQVKIVHVHQYAPFFYSSLARMVGHSCRILFTEHGRDYPDYRRWKRVWANKLLLKQSDRVVGVGECVRKALIEYEGLAPERVDVIYNGVDVESYDASRSQRNEVRSELGLLENDFTIIQVARLNRLKDHLTAIEAVHRFQHSTEARARLLLVGEGEEREAIERRVAELDLANHVTLLGLRNDVPRLLQCADVFLLSSITEGIPLTLLEAMLTRIPCIATRVGGIPEVIVHGQNGLLAEAGDSRAISDALLRLSVEADLADQLADAGRTTVLDQFSDQTMHARYHQLYREMTGASANANSEV